MTDDTTNDKLSIPLIDTPITMRTLQTLIQTPTVPRRYTQSPSGVQDMYAAILVGREVGIAPMEAIQNIYLINGSVSMSGKLMVALIYRAGHLMKVKFGAKKVTVECFRRDPYTHELVAVGETEFGEADAVAASLDQKDTYRQYPRLMWAWRAITFAGRLFYGDVLSGIGYTPEELEVSDVVEPIDVDVIDVEVEGKSLEMENGTAMLVDELDAEVIQDSTS